MLPTRSFVFGFLLLVGLSLVVQPASAQASRTVDRQFELARDGHLDLDTFSGTIEVTGWNQNTVDVEARIEGDNDELVEKTAIRFDEGMGRLGIEVDYDEVEDTQKFLGLFSIGDVDRPDVHFTIRMPRTASITVDDFSSEVEVDGLEGEVTLDTFSSSIHLRDLEGGFNVETFSGSVEGENLQGSVRLETFSGEVRLSMNALTDDSRFETFSGDVELTLPADASFELVGDDGSFGELHSDFDLTLEGGRRIAGEGGPEIDVESFSGSVRLRKR